MKYSIIILLSSMLLLAATCEKEPDKPPQDEVVVGHFKAPAEVQSGEKFRVEIHLINKSSEVWGGNHKLGSVGNDRTWGITRVPLSKPTVNPGEVSHFNFDLVAPEVGDEDKRMVFAFQLVHEHVRWIAPAIEGEVLIKRRPKLWKKIVDETGITDSDKAPFRGKYLGDVWSQWLEAPKAIQGMRRFVNITEYGIFLSHDGHWEKYLKGEQTLDEAVKSAGPTFGQKSLTLYDGLMVASKIGVPIMLTLDTSANYWPSGYHSSSKCIAAGRMICAPLVRSGELQKTKKLVGDILGYIEKTWPGLVQYVWWENEPGYRSYTPQRYEEMLRAFVPIIKSKMPRAKIGFDGDFKQKINYSGLGVHAVGYHFAIPKEPTDQLVNNIKARTRQMKSLYPGLEIWHDEFGVGYGWDLYTTQGRDRMIKGIQASFDAGATGVNYLVIGGTNPYNGGEFSVYTTDRGESMTAGALRDLARRYNIAW